MMKSNFMKPYFFLFLFFSCIYLQAELPDSIQKKLSDPKLHDTLRANAYIEAANHYINNNNKEAIKYSLKSKDLCEKIGYKRGTALALGWLTYLYKVSGENDKVRDCAEKMLIICKETGDRASAAAVMQNLADICREEGNVEEAMSKYISVLKEFESLKDSVRIALCLNNMSNIYLSQGLKEKAGECLMRSLKIRLRLGDKNAIAESYNNLASFYNKDETTFNIAKEYFLKSYDIYKELKNLRGLGYASNNLAALALREGDTLRSIELYETAIEMKEKAGEINGLASSLNAYGRLLLRCGKLNEAQSCFEKSYDLTEKSKSIELLAQASLGLKVIHKRKKNFEKALQYLEIYKTLNDTLFNQSNRKAVYKAQLDYEFDKKEALNKEQREREKAIEALNAERNKIVIWSVIAGLFMVIVFAIFITNRLRITKKQKQIIEEQKLLVEEQRKEMIDSMIYARRIQQTLMPSDANVEKNINRLKK